MKYNQDADNSCSIKLEEEGSGVTQLRQILDLMSTAGSRFGQDEVTIRSMTLIILGAVESVCIAFIQRHDPMTRHCQAWGTHWQRVGACILPVNPQAPLLNMITNHCNNPLKYPPGLVDFRLWLRLRLRRHRDYIVRPKISSNWVS